MGKHEEEMEQLMIEESGYEMIERAAIRATGGSWSRPVAHLVFKLENACSHQSGVVLARESTEDGGDSKDVEEGTDLVWVTFEVTEAKWLLRVLTIHL